MSDEYHPSLESNLYIPNEIWEIILNYAKHEESASSLKNKHELFDEKAKEISDTFEYGIDTISKTVTNITNKCNKIDRQISKLESLLYFSDETPLPIHRIDDYLLDIRHNINSLLFVALQLQESKTKYLLRGTQKINNPAYHNYYGNDYVVEL